MIASLYCQVLTAYARECERAGVRIPHWREETGCRNVKPFKYSGEHFSGETSASATTHLNATLNEVLTSYETGGGGEVLDQREEPLDLRGLGSLPAYRYKPGAPSGRAKTARSRKEARRKLKLQRRRERRRRQRGPGQDSLAASYAGLTLQLAGGERKRLQWGGGRGGRGGGVRPQPPPFDMLLSPVEDTSGDSVVPHTSGEVRTESEASEVSSSDSEGRQLTFSELPSHRRAGPPPPLRDSQSDLRNYKRRRHQS